MNNIKERKLISGVAEVLKVLTHFSDKSVIKVNYDFSHREVDGTDCRAYIFLPGEIVNTGNGYERTYSWELMEKLVDLVRKKNILFHVGETDSITLHIQVYVL